MDTQPNESENANMSLENASGGFTDLDVLARDETVVVARIREFHPEETSQEGFKSEPVTIDLLICTGDRKGEVVRGMKIKKNGVISTLRRSKVGKDVAGVITIKENPKRVDRQTGKPTLFVAMDPCDNVQLRMANEAYSPGGVTGAGFDGDSPLVNVGASSAPAAGGSAVADDDEPPF